jgi:tetratricopeptide (TPR) repeat protein
LDNVEDLTDIAELLGQVSGRGQVVVTTRRDPGRADWRRAGLQPIRLGVLDRPASVRLLLELTGSQDADGADRLADDLGDLPLALEQAAGYLSQNPIAFDAYRRLLAHRFAQVAKLGSEGGTTQRRVAGVWQQSMKLVVRRSPLAGRIMAVLACLAADELPEEVLAPLTDGDEAVLGHALALLTSYSMINRTGGAVSMHRLVQAVTTAYSPTPQSEQESFRGQATWLLSKAIPEDPVTNVTGWPRWNNLLPHIDALLNNLGPDHTDTIAMHLGDRAAMFRQHQGQLSPAITLFEQNLADRRRVLGDDHPDTLSSFHHLANAYRSAGRLVKAITMFEQVLTRRRRVLGNDHPETLNSRHNLAYTYLATGNPVEAITLLEQVLTDRRRVLGDDHPNTLISRDNLAGAYRSTGRLAEAIALLEQTVIDSRQVLGDDHPDTLILRRNLASAYVPAMRLPEAIALSEQVVIDSCRILGDDHPNTLIARRTLADAYQSAGRLAEAITLLEQTLTDSRKALGGDHPDTQAVASLLHRLRWNPDRSSTQ